MRCIPLPLKEANAFVLSFHRHNGPVQGALFALGCVVEDDVLDHLVGVAIVGRPVARLMQDGLTAEVTRVCVKSDAPKGACSFLYGRAWRVWQSMGGSRMITYTLSTESGASLRGAGWKVMGETKLRKEGQAWTGLENGRQRDRAWDPIYGQLKLRWHAPAGEPA